MKLSDQYEREVEEKRVKHDKQVQDALYLSLSSYNELRLSDRISNQGRSSKILLDHIELMQDISVLAYRNCRRTEPSCRSGVISRRTIEIWPIS